MPHTISPWVADEITFTNDVANGQAHATVTLRLVVPPGERPHETMKRIDPLIDALRGANPEMALSFGEEA